jgi:hypothetical protein
MSARSRALGAMSGRRVRVFAAIWSKSLSALGAHEQRERGRREPVALLDR